MEPQKVTERLFVSHRITPQIVQWCRTNHVTDVMNVAQELDDTRTLDPAEFRLHKIGLLDTGAPLPVQSLSQILSTGLRILSHPEDKLLVHCVAGKNRSPSACYLLLRGFGIPPLLSKTLIPGGSAPKYAGDVDNFLLRQKILRKS